jgi:hypothetical protein
VFCSCFLTLAELLELIVTGQKQENTDREAWSGVVAIKFAAIGRLLTFADETRLDNVSQFWHIIRLMTVRTVL